MYLDSTLGVNLDDSLSIMVYNLETTGDDSWINFMTQMVCVEDSEIPLYELISDGLEQDIMENAHSILNNPIDEEMKSLGYNLNEIEHVKVTRSLNGDFFIFGVLEVSLL